MSSPKKAVLIGLDGVSPVFLDRLIKEGILPNFKKLKDEGTFAPYCFSSLPTSTPENWTTIATGAWNGTHQVMSFQVFQPENLNGRWVVGYSSKENKAEFIWTAAERAGKKSIIVKYPASWPPTIKEGIQICGCHVRPCVHQLDNSHLFSTSSYPGGKTIKFVEAREWSNLPESELPPLESLIKFGGERKDVPTSKVTLRTPVCVIDENGKTFYLLLYSSSGKGYDRLVISREKDLDTKLAELSLGEWSDWIIEEFPTERGMRKGTIRFKLEELSPDAKSFRLYSTQIEDISEFCFPSSLGEELVENIGPFITDMGWEGIEFGWISDKTFLELADYQNNWLANAVLYLTQKFNWTLCFVQSHCIDCANHYCLSKGDILINRNKEEAEYYYSFIVELYKSLDKMLGKIIDNIDEDTLVIVISDHGGISSTGGRPVIEALESSGLIVTKQDPLTGLKEIDITKSKAYILNEVSINVNLKGLDQYGIVGLEDYEKVKEEIVYALQSYKDPNTGLNPFSLILRKEDARMIGLYGDEARRKIGDVIFALKPPFGGTHGPQLSTTTWGISSIGSLFLMKGPGIKRGYILDRTVWLVDIVPTICYLLDLPIPKDTQGSIIYQAMEDPDIKLKERKEIEEERDRWKSAYYREIDISHM